nr:hypothetical protein Iba_chr12aCG8410 [Ipomoea batatas]
MLPNALMDLMKLTRSSLMKEEILYISSQVEGAIGIIFSGRLTEVSNLESRFIQSCVLTAILVEAKRKPDNEVQEIGAPKTVTLTLRLPPVIRFSSDPN